MTSSITLIGMPGVGKTSIGKSLAKSLEIPFIDIDHIVSKNESLSIPRLIQTRGESTFKQLEETATFDLDFSIPQVISTGGSLIFSEKAMTHLNTHSDIVYLKDTPENIRSRIKDIDSRGIVGFPERSFREIYALREPLYEKWATLTYVLPDPFNRSKIVSDLLTKL